MTMITITITGNKQLRNKMGQIMLGVKDLTPAMKEIGEKAADYYQTQGFLSQGGVFGEDWPLLSRSYAVRKARIYPGRPPLVATGKMLSGFRYDASATGVIIGNRMPYFKYHQSTKPRTKMPRRASMGVNEPIRLIVNESIRQHISRKIRQA